MSAKRIPTARAWRWAVITAAVLPMATAMAGELVSKTIQDEFLDFNDNQVPSGWSLVVDSGGDNCGVAHRRFFSGEAENDCSLESAFTVLPSTRNVTVKWKGNLVQTGNGNYQKVALSTASGEWVSVRIGPDHSHTNNGVILAVMRGTLGEFIRYTNVPDGVYHFTLQVTGNEMAFTGKVNGAQVFRAGGPLTDFQLSSLRQIGLETYQSIGKDQWMDNVSIRQFTCEHPVHQSCD